MRLVFQGIASRGCLIRAEDGYGSSELFRRAVRAGARRPAAEAHSPVGRGYGNSVIDAPDSLVVELFRCLPGLVIPGRADDVRRASADAQALDAYFVS